MNLNHIFFFLAVVSPLLVLARAWRPGAPYHGWRLAALIVLAVAAVAWILRPAAAGYIGGSAWLLLLFVPAVGLRKVAQLVARGDYQAAGRLGAGLQILHPSAELREQVRSFRQLQSNPALRTNFSSVPANHAMAASARRSQFQHAPAVLTGEYWRLLAALFLHGGFLHLGFNLFALYVLGPPLERAIGTMRFAACYVLSG